MDNGRLQKTSKWECKDCHKEVTGDETIAYRLLNGILYGWCPQCFKLNGVHKENSLQDSPVLHPDSHESSQSSLYDQNVVSLPA